MTLIDQAWVLAQPEVMQIGSDVGESIFKQFQGLVDDAKPAAIEVAALFKQAAIFKAHAVCAADPQAKQDYNEAVTTTIRRAKTLALAEGVVATDREAAWLEAAGTAIINGIEVVGTKVLTMVFTAALNAATGGAGSSIGGLIANAVSKGGL